MVIPNNWDILARNIIHIIVQLRVWLIIQLDK